MSGHPPGLHPSHRADPVPSRPSGEAKTGFWRSRIGIVTIVFLAIAGGLLIVEHRAHALGVLPYLPLLAFPFLHLFMHGGHGSHGGRGGHRGHGGGDDSEPSVRSDTTTERKD